MSWIHVLNGNESMHGSLKYNFIIMHTPDTRLAQVLKHFFIDVPYHILVASLTLMALFCNRAIRERLAPSI